MAKLYMSDDISEQKKQIRKDIQQLKSFHSREEIKIKSDIIFTRIEALDVFINSGPTLIFWSLDHEVQTHDFIIKWYKVKKMILPVIRGNELELKLFTGKENLSTGAGFGIQEPLGETYQYYDEIKLAIIPGVAFDLNKNRLGWGKAYYDRLLPQLKVFKIGICFDFQLLDETPVTETDVKMDMIVWNNGIIR